MGSLSRAALGAVVVVSGTLINTVTQAETPEAIEARLRRLEAVLEAQTRRIAEQDKILADQSRLLNQQAATLTALQDGKLADLRGTGGSGFVVPADQAIATAPQTSAQAPAPSYAQVEPVSPGPRPPGAAQRPVGEAPPPEPTVEVAALPERSGVLTPQGQFVLEPAIDYTHASTNRLVFRGVEIVTGVQVGVIEASDADRNGAGLSISGRYGLTRRLEVQATIPYVTRSDRVTTLAQRDDTITRTQHLDGNGFGDIELAARYQLNEARPGRPVFIGGLRIKTDTGSSPFEIGRDEFGVAKRLATGSGFWGIEPGITFLYPTDPIVIFGGVTYLYHMPKDINRTIGDAPIGEVDPGDAIGANAGFGFAINPRFSFSMGYRHSYILPTKSEIGTTRQKSESLQVGTFTFGWSFRLTERMTLSNGYEFGATSDAPDVRVVFRLPYRF